MAQDQFFRVGAGTVIYDKSGQILLFERSDDVNSWQLQQGGMEAGEKMEDTLWRELEEETALVKEDFIKVAPYPEWLLYEYDEAVRQKLWDMNCLGQIHRWFYLEIKPDVVIDITKATHPEFSNWRWGTFDELLELHRSWKLPVYQKLAEFFKNEIIS